MTIVSNGLFKRLKHTKANMNHIGADKKPVANDDMAVKKNLLRAKRVKSDK